VSGTSRYLVIVAAKLLSVGRDFATTCVARGRFFDPFDASECIDLLFCCTRMPGLRALHAEVKDVQCMQGVFG